MKRKSSSVVRVGVIGCGNISKQYFKGVKPFADVVQITACSDLDVERARAAASEFGIEKACSVEELLADPNIDLVLNLTLPQAHAAVNLAAIKAGKHAYCEKPFSLNTKEGARVLAAADKRKLRVGCAPDTVLGGGIQTCRKLIDDGAIGKPVAAIANMACRGHEHWHPSPEFYYQKGGGPLFDMGPYYLGSLLTMFGPARMVTAAAKSAYKERLITSQPLNGKKVKVETPTHLSGLLEFENGVLATVTMSFDVKAHHLPRLEIYGTEGSLSCPDPNRFDGEVQLWRQDHGEWKSIPLTHNDQVGRGIGIAEMAYAIQKRKPHRMSGEMGLHLVEIMEAFHRSAEGRKAVKLKTDFKKPKALGGGLELGRLE